MDIFLRTSIGDIVLDAELSEGHTSDLRITDNPVESGAAVSDHAVLEPKSVQIEGVIVDYEPPLIAPLGLSSLMPRSVPDFLNLMPMASDFSVVTEQARSYATRALSSYVATTTGMTGGPVRTLAPWLPGLVGGGVDATGSGSRVQQIYDSLLTLQKSGETVDIQTGLRLYTNMLLPSITGYETQRGSLRVYIYARELLIVETRTIAGVQVPTAGNNKSGRASSQAAAKASRGNTNPNDVPPEKNRSAIREIFG